MIQIRQKRKSFFDCSRRNKFKQKSLIANQAEKLSEFCQTIGLK